MGINNNYDDKLLQILEERQHKDKVIISGGVRQGFQFNGKMINNKGYNIVSSDKNDKTNNKDFSTILNESILEIKDK